MQHQKWQDRKVTCGCLVRSTLIGTAILLILGVGAVWILNVEGIIKGSWSSPLAVAFGVIGALFTFLQWALPLSSTSSKVATDIHPSAKTGEIPQQTKEAAMELVRQKQEALHKLIEDQLTEQTGALVIYVDKEDIGREIKLVPQEYWETDEVRRHFNIDKINAKAMVTYVNRRTIDGYPLYIATFLELYPGHYVAYVFEEWEMVIYTHLAIFSKQVAELGWSKEGR